MSRLSPEPGLLLFGGAFNPPHLSHRRILEAARRQLGVGDCLVLPSGQHPLKADLAGAADRLEMCRLAFADLPGVIIDPRETRRSGPAYTVLTLRELRDEHPGRDLFWLIGSDNLRILEQWHCRDEVLQLARLVTYPRAGAAIEPQQLRAQGLTQAQVAQLCADVLDLEGLDPDARNATQLRVSLAAGGMDAAAADLAPAVLQYIERHGVYTR